MSVLFMSYRRSDSQDVTGRIYDRLVAKFPKKQVFRDIDNIPLGITFPVHLKRVLGKCDVVVVIIGRDWVTATDSQGRRRLDDPNDFVRIEVEAALRAQVPVIPVLVSNASMPLADELPLSIRSLVTRNGIAVRPDPDFGHDMDRLIRGIEQVLKLPIKGKPRPETTERNKPSQPVSENRGTGTRGCLLRIGALTISLACVLLCVATPAAWFVLSSRFGPAVVPKDTDAPAAGPKDKDKPDVKNDAQLAKDLQLDLGGGVKMNLVRIDPGTFRMGSPETEAERDPDSEFQHEVTITRAFYIGVYTVTQAQYRQVIAKNPSNFSATGTGKDKVAGMNTDDFPVEMVTWHAAMDFCRAVSGRAELNSKGWTMDLPTEAEWEYACRAGTTSAFHYGDFLSGKQANFSSESPYGAAPKVPRLNRTCYVGGYRPNSWGLYDMHGNVLQWCKDWYGKDYYRSSGRSDPLNETPDVGRVLRGGSWYASAKLCRSAQRLHDEPGITRQYDDSGWLVAIIGFRVVVRPSR
jgi:formylglycine-generating enzyme required for sulfatase activity